MKTTIDLDDALLARVKRLAAAEGTTLRAVVEEALRARLMPRSKTRQPYTFSPPTVRGTAAPAADIADRNAVHDLLDESQ